MSLPLHWVDKIFEKLTLTYGQDFLARYRDVSISLVKSNWGFELAGFAAHPDGIAWALQNLPPDRPPTVLQFRDLCRKAPAPDMPRLPEPKADPGKVAAEFQKLAPLRGAAVEHDHLAWARRAVGRHADGEYVAPYTLACAREALGRSVVRMPATAGEIAA